MSNEVSATPEYSLEVAMLFERINKGRKMRSLTPVENNAIASRCNLRFNMGREERIDFNQERVLLNAGDIDALEQLLNEQFDCMLEGDVKKLCIRKTAPRPATPEPTPAAEPPPQPAASQATAKPNKQAGLMSKIKKAFGNE